MEEAKNKIYKVERLSLPDQIYSALKEMIADRRFEYGRNINVEQLTRELGVSRTPVWEAVIRLEQEGVLERTRHKGVRLRQLTREMALDLYQVRLAVENLAVELASEKMTRNVVKELEIYQKGMKDLVEQGEPIDVVSYSRLDHRYHMLIAETSGNALVQEILLSLRYKALPLAFRLSPYLPEFITFHKDIIDGLARHDKASAMEAMLRHNRRMIGLVKELPWGVDE